MGRRGCGSKVKCRLMEGVEGVMYITLPSGMHVQFNSNLKITWTQTGLFITRTGLFINLIWTFSIFELKIQIFRTCVVLSLLRYDMKITS